MVENALVFDFELSDEEMKTLDALTKADSIEAFVELYRKCVNRDTSKNGSLDGVKMEITGD
jgi:diketogulonate reductase-like aldo/keto reductase